LGVATESHIALLHPNAPLAADINRWTASDKRREAWQCFEIENCQLKDARPSYAVRAIRAGAPFEVVAQQLGPVDTTMAVKVHSRFRPTEQERIDWERIAAAQDEQRRASAQETGLSPD
jgi:hypothetical protein